MSDPLLHFNSDLDTDCGIFVLLARWSILTTIFLCFCIKFYKCNSRYGIGPLYLLLKYLTFSSVFTGSVSKLI